MTERERYPLAKEALARLDAGSAAAPLSPFAIGPSVLRPAPARSSPPLPTPTAEPSEGGAADPGELVEMMLVGADQSDTGRHEVHLLFKSDVLGGLQLVLQKEPDGMRARFLVQDAAARRAVAAQVDALIAHLRGRGFAIVSHAIDIVGD